jgi:hypothetical protein
MENAAELLIESALRFSQNDSISRDQLSHGFDSIIKNLISSLNIYRHMTFISHTQEAMGVCSDTGCPCTYSTLGLY